MEGFYDFRWIMSAEFRSLHLKALSIFLIFYFFGTRQAMYAFTLNLVLS